MMLIYYLMPCLYIAYNSGKRDVSFIISLLESSLLLYLVVFQLVPIYSSLSHSAISVSDCFLSHSVINKREKKEKNVPSQGHL